MIVYPFAPAYPKEELVTSPDSFFGSIKHEYTEYRKNGIYKDYGQETFFVYRIKTEDKDYTGLLTMTDIKDMHKKRILKHEKTLASREQKMMHLFLQRQALVKPILLFYRPKKNIKSILTSVRKTKPLVDFNFESSNENHQVWAVKDPADIKTISAELGKLEKAYIGDGHHRSTTLQLLSKSKEFGRESQKFKFLYSAYFDMDEIEIKDYNRVVDISEIISLPEFIVGMSKYFEIEPLDKAAKPKRKHEVTAYFGEKWYKLRWKKKYLNNKKEKVLLDSMLVNKYVFNHILGIKDIRVDTRIKYFAGTEPLKKIENSSKKKDQGIGICIYPVAIKELIKIADSNQTLPPKSTWFLPRIRSGMLAKDL